MLLAIFKNFPFGQKQEGPDDFLPFRKDTVQAANTGTPKQVKKKCFRIVVHVMSRCNIPISLCCSYFFEPSVTKLPRSFLYGEAVFFGVFTGIKMNQDRKSVV